MKISKTQIIGTLGGLAVIAGASYYFHRRKQNLMSPLDKFKQSIKNYKFNNIIQIQQNFEYLFHQEVGQYLIDIGSSQNIDDDKKKRCCNEVIQHGYQCYDCIPQDQFGPTQIEQNSESVYRLFINTICEDCFDEEIHRGHRYIQVQLEELTYCCCGSSYMMPEQNFCKNHKGLKDLKTEYIESFQVEIKEKIINFFKETISFVIENAADMISKSNKRNKVQILTKCNSLLTMIQNQILQLIQDNNIFIYCFIELFQQKINTPTLVDTRDLNELLFLKSKRVDQKETILDYLFRFIPLYNDNTLTQFDIILRYISQSDEDFSGILIQKFLKFHKIILSQYFYENNCEDPNILIRISEIFTTCQNGLNTYKNIYATNIHYQKQSLDLIKMFKKLVKQFEFKEFQDIEWIILQNFNKQLQSIMKFPQIIDEFSQIDELLKEILSYYSYFNDFFILGEKGVSLFQDLIQKNEKFYYLQTFQIYLQESVNYFTYCLIKLEKKELNLKFRKILADAIEFEVCRIIINLKQFYEKNKFYKYHYGLQTINFIIILFLLSQKPLNYQGVKETFKENFCESNEEKINYLILKILFVLKFYIPQEINESDSSIYEDILEELNESEIDFMLDIHEYSRAACYLKYDNHILTFQIVQLIAPKNYNLSLANLITMGLGKPINHVFFKNKVLTTQILFDQTPILSYMYDHKYIFTDEKSSTENFKKAIQSTIVGFINFNDSNQILLSNIQDKIQFYLSDPQLAELVEEEINELCDVRNSYIQKKSTNQLTNNLNMGRHLIDVELDVQEKLIENLIYFTEKQDFYKDLFDFQKQLIIREYSNLQFYKSAQDLLFMNKNTENILDLLNEYFIMFYTTIEISKEMSNIFTKDQLQDITQIQKEFYSKDVLKEQVSIYKSQQIQNVIEKRRDIKNFYEIINKKYNDKYGDDQKKQ